MNGKGQIIAAIFLIGVNLTGLATEEELQKPVDRRIYDILTPAAPDAKSWEGESMATTDLAVSKAEVQQKLIPITTYCSSDLISSFVGEATISRFRGITNYQISTDAEDYALNDYIADARVVLVEPVHQMPLASFEGTVIRIKQEHEVIYHIITDYSGDYQQSYRIEVELDQRRLLTLPKDEVKILSPPDLNRQVAPSQDSLVYFRQPENAQPIDTVSRNSIFLWIGIIVIEYISGVKKILLNRRKKADLPLKPLHLE